jgi:hypothetical protein
MWVRTVTLAKHLCWNPCKFSEIKNTDVLDESAASVCGVKIETAVSSETLVPIYQTTWHQISEYHKLNIHCYKNLKSHLPKSCFKIIIWSPNRKVAFLLYKKMLTSGSMVSMPSSCSHSATRAAAATAVFLLVSLPLEDGEQDWGRCEYRLLPLLVLLPLTAPAVCLDWQHCAARSCRTISLYADSGQSDGGSERQL